MALRSTEVVFNKSTVNSHHIAAAAIPIWMKARPNVWNCGSQHSKRPAFFFLKKELKKSWTYLFSYLDNKNVFGAVAAWTGSFVINENRRPFLRSVLLLLLSPGL